MYETLIYCMYEKKKTVLAEFCGNSNAQKVGNYYIKLLHNPNTNFQPDHDLYFNIFIYYRLYLK